MNKKQKTRQINSIIEKARNLGINPIDAFTCKKIYLNGNVIYKKTYKGE